MVTEFAKSCGIAIPFVFGDRREGDLAAFHANPQKAENELKWRAVHSLADMCKDSFRFEKSKINNDILD